MVWWLGPEKRRVPTMTNIVVTNELEVVAYGVVAWTQRGVPTMTNIAMTNEDVGSSKDGVLLGSHIGQVWD
nr:hypothetical protein [Tanacetum cinerariifolium]